MSNIFAFGVIVAIFIVLIFASLKIRKEKLSIGKFVGLVLLPSTLMGIFMYIVALYSYFFKVEDYKFFPSISYIFFPAIYGLIMMLPSLMFYAVNILSLEKKFSPSKWKLFIWAGLLGGVSASPYLIILPLEFLLLPIITGSLAMMIVYFISQLKKGDSNESR